MSFANFILSVALLGVSLALAGCQGSQEPRIVDLEAHPTGFGVICRDETGLATLVATGFTRLAPPQAGMVLLETSDEEPKVVVAEEAMKNCSLWEGESKLPSPF